VNYFIQWWIAGVFPQTAGWIDRKATCHPQLSVLFTRQRRKQAAIWIASIVAVLVSAIETRKAVFFILCVPVKK
jgi:hypothetical protein